MVWLAANKIGDEGARGLGDGLKTNTTLAQLDLRSEQQDHKETLKKSKANTTARGVTGQATGSVMKERVDWCLS